MTAEAGAAVSCDFAAAGEDAMVAKAASTSTAETSSAVVIAAAVAETMAPVAATNSAATVHMMAVNVPAAVQAGQFFFSQLRRRSHQAYRTSFLEYPPQWDVAAVF